jgi:hypothetical protein
MQGDAELALDLLQAAAAPVRHAGQCEADGQQADAGVQAERPGAGERADEGEEGEGDGEVVPRLTVAVLSAALRTSGG